MASLRRLRRRLLRWERYAATTGHKSPRDRWSDARLWLSGHCRAFDAVEAEDERRFWAKTPEVWLGGPEGEAALIADVYDPRCCIAGELGHDGPCVIRCDGCNGDGRCPECGGIDDLGCWHCDGSGGCPHHCDDGEIVLNDWAAS